MIECEECDGKGWYYVRCGDHNTDDKKEKCHECDGSGVKYVEE